MPILNKESPFEGQTYICSWRKQRTGYEIFLESNPSLRAHSPSWFEAEEELLNLICKENGDGEAKIVYLPPRPDGEFELKYGFPALYTISGIRAEPDIVTANLFVNGLCYKCGNPMGPRNSSILSIKNTGIKTDCCFVVIGRTFIYLFSESLLNLLIGRHWKKMNFNSVVMSGKRKDAQLYELVGKPECEFVGCSFLKHSGWECAECGSSGFGYYESNLEINKFVAYADLPNPLSQYFTVGDSNTIKICVTGKTWLSLIRPSVFKGLSGNRLGVVSDDELIRKPQLLLR